jgi:hypothetical protein
MKLACISQKNFIDATITHSGTSTIVQCCNLDHRSVLSSRLSPRAVISTIGGDLKSGAAAPSGHEISSCGRDDNKSRNDGEDRNDRVV